MSKTYQQKSYLEEAYVHRQMTMKQIAVEHDVNIVTIHNWLKKHGIKRRDPNHREAGYRDISILSHHYLEENLTMAEIAEIYDVSVSVIRDWMIKFNIRSRQAGQQPGKPLSDKQKTAMKPFWDSLKGRKLSSETKEKLRFSKIGSKNPNFGKKAKNKGRYWFQCPDGSFVCMRSNWEVSYAKWLITNGHNDWSYEPKTFILSDGSAYTPDFWVPYLNSFVEVKGWLQEDGKKKLDLFKRDYPETQLLLANREYLTSIGCDLFTKNESTKPKGICTYCKSEFNKKYKTQMTCSIPCRNKYIVSIRKMG